MFFKQFSRLEVLVLLACCVPMFVMLGVGEVQSWDEGLFALRARAVLEQGDAFWNQEPYAAGGLYSATYPPLSVWGISACMAIFGQNEFGLRLFSALCGSLSIFLLFGIVKANLRPALHPQTQASLSAAELDAVKTTISRNYSLLAGGLLAAALSWQTYARFGMSDVPLVTCFLGAFWCLLRLMQTDTRTGRRKMAIYFALWFCAALMTKIVVSFTPLLFVAVLWFLASGKLLDFRTKLARGQQRRVLLYGSIAAVLLAAPWYINMLISYGPEFYEALAPPHIYKQAEGGPALRAWWFYANRLVVDCPLLLAGLLMFARTLKSLRAERRQAQAATAPRNAGKPDTDYPAAQMLLTVCAVWFGFYFLFFTLAQTRMPHYVLPMLPPLIVGVAAFIRHLYRNRGKLQWTNNIVVFTAPALMMWSVLDELRSNLQTEGLQPMLFLAVGVPTALFCIHYWMHRKSRKDLTALTYRLFVFVAVVTGVSAAQHNKSAATNRTDGAAAIAQKLEEIGTDSLLVLTHARNRGDWLVPQLTWYTDGWALNRLPGKFASVYGLREWEFDGSVLEHASNKYPNAHIVYHFSPDYGKVQTTTERYLARQRPILMIRKRYVLFGPQSDEQPKPQDPSRPADAETSDSSSTSSNYSIDQPHAKPSRPPQNL